MNTHVNHAPRGILHKYRETSEPARSIYTADGQQIRMEVMVCKVRCDACGHISLDRVYFVC